MIIMADIMAIRVKKRYDARQYVAGA